MIQDTAGRVTDGSVFGPPMVVCNEEHRFLVAEQLRQIGLPAGGVVLEPAGRNTAPAVALAALRIMAEDPNALMLVLPADHVITDLAGFRAIVAQGRAAAEAGRLVTFGIVPTAPETGYGYIACGAALETLPGTFRVDAFVEKPPRDVAEAYVAGGRHFWNSGMFLFPVGRVLAELERFEPALLATCRRAIAHGVGDADFFRPERDAFLASPAISIDCAVMERTEHAAMVTADIGWSDVGAWPALWEISERDDDGNVRLGDAIGLGNHNCYLRSEGPLVAALGLSDTIVVATDDAVLVADRTMSDQIKGLLETMKRGGRAELINHRKVHRPWGSYHLLHHGDRFQVKRLTINPGARLSLQLHYHRAEHWVVVRGTALITRGTEQSLLRENESAFIPLGIPHRLENPGRIPLDLIEVQSGAYLEEDDIVRFSDTYGRCPEAGTG